MGALLTRYIEDRRPPNVPIGQWRRSTETLLRRPPDTKAPMSAAVGRRRIEDMFDRLHRNAPDLFAHDDVSLHSYCHALGTFIDARYGRPVTRAVLGHTSRRSPTDHYVHVPIEQLTDVLTAYETHLLGGST